MNATIPAESSAAPTITRTIGARLPISGRWRLGLPHLGDRLAGANFKLMRYPPAFSLQRGRRRSGEQEEPQQEADHGQLDADHHDPPERRAAGAVARLLDSRLARHPAQPRQALLAPPHTHCPGPRGPAPATTP